MVTQWFHDDDFDTPLPEWVADEVATCYGKDHIGFSFAQSLAAFLDARNLRIVRGQEPLAAEGGDNA